MTSWVIDFVQLGQGHQHQGFSIEDGTILNFDSYVNREGREKRKAQKIQHPQAID